MIGEVVMEMLIPMKTKEIINLVSGMDAGNTDIGPVLVCGLTMVLMAVVSMCFGMAGSRLGAIGGMGVAANMRMGIFKKVQGFSFKNIDKFSTASLVTRLTTDVNTMQNTTIMTIKMAFRAPVMVVTASVMAFRMNASLTTVLLIAAPVLLCCLLIIMKLAFPRFKVMMKKYDALNASVQENLIGIRVVKAFVRSEHEKKKFEYSSDDVMKTQRSAERVVLWNGPIMQIIMNVSIVAVLWFGGKQIISGEFDVGGLTAYITYLSQILMSLMMVSFLFISFVMSKASATRIGEVLDEEADIVSPENAVREVADGSIEFRNVSFSYDGTMENPVLQHIDLSIASGETIGVIGATGSAKTTLMSLIPRLYDVTDGELLVGGKNVKEYDIHALRDQVSMVLQKNVLFSGSIKENLKWGDAGASDEEITEACRIAAADQFVRAFPDGYDMDLGQGGVNVSGGQKQRLCIARALLKKPKIMILDDATSAVDTATDASIRSALKENMGNTTTIIIAQRIASVMDADRILVLDDGKVSDFGSHDELMARSEIYRDVYTSQLKGTEEADAAAAVSAAEKEVK
ncbi:MAG: ABC transporter [Clostridiales bacterium]|nr:ABC transporter [Clostridiales bacterium]